MKKTILITGASGYVATNFIRYIKSYFSKQYYIIGVSRHKKHNLCDEYIETDIFKDFIMIDRPDILIHCAWDNGYKHNDVSHIENVSNHFKFIKYIYNIGCRHISCIGTMHEIGYANGIVTEDVVCNPTTIYGISKYAFCKCLQLFFNLNPCCFQWIRLFHILDDDGKNIFAAFNNSTDVFNCVPANIKYDFINPLELNKNILKIINQTQIDGIINCCSGIPTSIQDALAMINKKLNKNVKINYGAYAYKYAEDYCLIGSTQKISMIK